MENVGSRVLKNWVVWAAVVGFAGLALAIAITGDKPGNNLSGDPPAAPASPRALALIAEAEQLLNRGDEQGARDSYDRARILYRDGGDILGEAAVAYGLGRLEHVTGQSDAARFKFSAALSLFEHSGDALGQAQVLVALGDLEKDTFNWDAAKQYYRDARFQWDLAPGPKTNPHVLLGLERLPEMPDGEAKARADLSQAELIFHQVGDPAGKGDVAALTARLELNLGNLEKAVHGYQNARMNYQAAGELWHEADANLRLGLILIKAGYNADSQRALDVATFLFDAAADDVGAARVEAARGDLERLQGRMEEARGHYATAAEALQSVSDRGAPDAWMGLGEVEALLGNVSQASSAFEAAGALHGRFRDDGGEARSALALGNLALAGDQLSPARTHLARAALRFEAAGDGLGEGRAWYGLGQIEAAERHTGAAREAYAKAAVLYEPAGVTIGMVLTGLAIGDLERGLNESSAAARAYRTANDVFAELASPVADANLYLGLPAVQTVGVRFLFDENVDYTPAGDIDEPDEEIPDRAAMEAENLETFSNHNLEARALVADLSVRIEAAMRFVETLN